MSYNPDSEATKNEVHPLLAKEIKPLKNWSEFLQSWESVNTIDQMVAVLNAGFTFSADNPVERILFYLQIADGWENKNILQKPTESTERAQCYYLSGEKIWKSPAELRQIIAVKAFQMLCQYVFKVDLLIREDYVVYFNEVWEEEFTSELLFPAIMNFFRIEEHEISICDTEATIRNLVRPWKMSEEIKPAYEFLSNLALFMWDWKVRERCEDKEKRSKRIQKNIALRARLDAAKPWMVEVLVALDQLDVLRRYILELDEACIVRLKEIALRSELYASSHCVQETRKVKTIDEACYAGSKAAWFLKEYELKNRENQRLLAIKEAEIQREIVAQKNSQPKCVIINNYHVL